jgi:hypothetical protein
VALRLAPVGAVVSDFTAPDATMVLEVTDPIDAARGRAAAAAVDAVEAAGAAEALLRVAVTAGALVAPALGLAGACLSFSVRARRK